MLSNTYMKMVLQQQLFCYATKSCNVLVWLMKKATREVIKKKKYKTKYHIQAEFFDINQILLESDGSPPYPVIFTM